MDESIQKQIEDSLKERPEHWVWKYHNPVAAGIYATSAGYCGMCVRAAAQTRRDCEVGHSSAMDTAYSGQPVLYAD